VRPRSRSRTGPRELPFVFEYSGLWPHPVSLLDTLCTEYGDLPFATLQGSYGWVIRNDQAKSREALGISTLREYIGLFRRADPPKLPYLMHLAVNRHLPRLKSRFVLPPEFRPNWADLPGLDRISGPELFIGQRGTGFGPVHIDHVAVHVGFVQLEGEKEFLLFPPEDGQYLYRYPGAQFPWQLRNSRVRNLDPSSLERFPLLRRTHPVSLVLKAGQALFLPANWWHTTINHSNTVSYSIRIVNHTNVLRTTAEYAAGLPRAAARLLRGRSVA
jgi:hypothetical protein